MRNNTIRKILAAITLASMMLSFQPIYAAQSVTYIVVGGGGGGGGTNGDSASRGGGGGAGGYLPGATLVTTGTGYVITIGNGGSGATGCNSASPCAKGTNGSNTSAFSVTASGGGGGSAGGRASGSVNPEVGAAGASGGGAGAGNCLSIAQGGSSGIGGFDGGYGGGGCSQGTGGGGGGSSVGSPTNDDTTNGGNGNGGAGTSSSISGSAVTYAAGGKGGGGSVAAGTGANTGNGGDGGTGTTQSGVTGRSGVVIISAPTSLGISATGGTHTTSGSNDIWTFTSSGTWTPTFTSSFLSNFNYCKVITIDHTKVVGADQTGFPVLFDNTDANLASHADKNGGDITFTDSSNNLLQFEKEKYTSSVGAITAWASTTVSTSVDTVLHMFYGTTTNANGGYQNISGVWDSNYKAVYHTASNKDATSNANTVNEAGSPEVTGGKIDGGYTTGASKYGMTLTDLSAVTGNMTASAWVKWTTSQGNTGILSQWKTTDNWVLLTDFLSNDKLKFVIRVGAANSVAGSANTYNDGNWHYVVGKFDGSHVLLRIDGGAESITGDATVGPIDNNAAAIGVGIYAATEVFTGSIDEARVSTVARSNNWIDTEYNNQNATSTFYKSISAEYDSTCAPAGAAPATTNSPSMQIRGQVNLQGKATI